MKGHRIRFEITGSDAGKPITGGDKQGFRVKIVGFADRNCNEIEANKSDFEKLPRGHWEELKKTLLNKECPREKQIGDFYYHIERIGNSL